MRYMFYTGYHPSQHRLRYPSVPVRAKQPPELANKLSEQIFQSSFSFSTCLLLFTVAKVADKDFINHKVPLITCDNIVSFPLHAFPLAQVMPLWNANSCHHKDAYFRLLESRLTLLYWWVLWNVTISEARKYSHSSSTRHGFLTDASGVSIRIFRCSEESSMCLRTRITSGLS